MAGTIPRGAEAKVGPCFLIYRVPPLPGLIVPVALRSEIGCSKIASLFRLSMRRC